MKTPTNWFARSWYPALLFLGSTTIVSLLLWLELDSLVPGLSKQEAAQATSSASLQAIWDNPIGLPHKLLSFGLQQIDQIVPVPVRSASALLGLLVAGSFFFVLRHWYTRRVALLGTLLFVCSAWFLHSARLGTDSITYALLITSTACVVWLQKHNSGTLAICASLLLVVFLLYIPGMIWFVVPVILWQIQRISLFLKDQHPAFLTLITFLAVGALVPLGWALYQDPDLVRGYFGLPYSFPAPLEILKNIGDVPVQLFYRGPNDPQTWLGRLAYIDWFTIVMFAVGLYAYIFKRRLDRTWFMAYVFIAGIILVGIGGPVTISIVMPFIYLIAAGGVALMLQQWFTVFPSNPVARAIGACLIATAVFASAFYNANHYFIAWPNTPATRAVFQHKLD